MIATRLTTLLLALGLSTVPIFGCGGDEEEEGTESEMSSDVDQTESEGGDGVAGEMASLQKDLHDVILSIETVDDAEAADPKVEAIYTQMADLIRKYANDPSLASAQSDPAAREYEQKMQDHLMKISTENPQLGLAIGSLMMKHIDKLTDAAGDILGSQDLEVLDEAGKALDDAEKALEGLSGE
jgi:hypothetical protein